MTEYNNPRAKDLVARAEALDNEATEIYHGNATMRSSMNWMYMGEVIPEAETKSNEARELKACARTIENLSKKRLIGKFLSEMYYKIVA